MSRRISNFFQNRLWNTKPEKMKSTELLSYLWTRFMVILHFRNSHFYHLMYQRKLWYLQIDWRQIAKIKTLISDLVFSQKTVGLYATLHLHVILIYNPATENEFDFYCLLKKVKKNQWFIGSLLDNIGIIWSWPSPTIWLMLSFMMELGELLPSMKLLPRWWTPSLIFLPGINTIRWFWITLPIIWWSNIVSLPWTLNVINCRL